MPLYGYYGNADEQHHGTAAVVSGQTKIPMGSSGTLTTQEADRLIAQGIDLRPLASPTTVRTDFSKFSFKR